MEPHDNGISSSLTDAAIIIQRNVRGMLSRKQIRIKRLMNAAGGAINSALSEVGDGIEDAMGTAKRSMGYKDTTLSENSFTMTDIENLKSYRRENNFTGGVAKEVSNVYTQPRSVSPEHVAGVKRVIRLRIGKYRIGKSFYTRPYAYIPTGLMQDPEFSLADVFKALDIPLPNIVLRVPKIKDPMFWNVKLPKRKEDLRIKCTKMAQTPDAAPDPCLVHYEGVLRENCKRLLSGTTSACKQVGAIFRLSPKWEDARDADYAGKWLTAKSKVVLLGIGGSTDYHPYVWDQLVKRGLDDSASDQVVEIDDKPFLDNEVPLFINPETDSVSGTFPHPDLTHLIISDNIPLLEQKLAELLPWGLM
jgi:hypothetical protein